MCWITYDSLLRCRSSLKRQYKNLGPKQRKEMEYEVYDENGQATKDINTVLKIWEQCSKELFDTKNDPTFDSNFLKQKLEDLKNLEKKRHKISPTA